MGVIKWLRGKNLRGADRFAHRGRHGLAALIRKVVLFPAIACLMLILTQFLPRLTLLVHIALLIKLVCWPILMVEIDYFASRLHLTVQCWHTKIIWSENIQF